MHMWRLLAAAIVVFGSRSTSPMSSARREMTSGGDDRGFPVPISPDQLCEGTTRYPVAKKPRVLVRSAKNHAPPGHALTADRYLARRAADADVCLSG